MRTLGVWPSGVWTFGSVCSCALADTGTAASSGMGIFMSASSGRVSYINSGVGSLGLLSVGMANVSTVRVRSSATCSAIFVSASSGRVSNISSCVGSLGLRFLSYFIFGVRG